MEDCQLEPAVFEAFDIGQLSSIMEELKVSVCLYHCGRQPFSEANNVGWDLISAFSPIFK